MHFVSVYARIPYIEISAVLHAIAIVGTVHVRLVSVYILYSNKLSRRTIFVDCRFQNFAETIFTDQGFR